jgi:hypothetical protein
MGLRNFKKENFRPYFPLLFENTETEDFADLKQFKKLKIYSN